MCIIIVKPAGIELPTLDIFENCKNRNHDGFGFSVPNEKPFKTLYYNEFIKAIRHVKKDVPCIIHFRYATHGAITKRNSHPFKIDDISFAHNGILKIEDLEGMTDSETAFKYILDPAIKIYGIHSKEFAATVETIIGSSKFAFLTDAGEIKMYGQYISENGLFFSNESYLPYSYNYYRPAKKEYQQKYLNEMFSDYNAELRENLNHIINTTRHE